uniref:Uncharacterized protein n=1 Tax=Rhizophora mucronata TaxID=61149 RepID=A0A2P2PAI9_RHIMU
MQETKKQHENHLGGKLHLSFPQGDKIHPHIALRIVLN